MALRFLILSFFLCCFSWQAFSSSEWCDLVPQAGKPGTLVKLQQALEDELAKEKRDEMKVAELCQELIRVYEIFISQHKQTPVSEESSSESQSIRETFSEAYIYYSRAFVILTPFGIRSFVLSIASSCIGSK